MTNINTLKKRLADWQEEKESNRHGKAYLADKTISEIQVLIDKHHSNKPVEPTATRCACEPGQGGPCSFCMEEKYNQ
jgi:hypothetical protein